MTAETLATVVDAVGQQWSQPSDLADALELLGRESLLKAAADQQQLDTVERHRHPDHAGSGHETDLDAVVGGQGDALERGELGVGAGAVRVITPPMPTPAPVPRSVRALVASGLGKLSPSILCQMAIATLCWPCLR